MQKLTTKQMASLYGVSSRTLRFYEDRGLLEPEKENSVRSYASKDRVRLELILKGKRFGWSLSEIKAMLLSKPTGNSTRDRDPFLSLERQKLATQIARLEQERDRIVDAIRDLQDALARGID